eukprot:CAMPEP_0201964192 /NCGR_PEP_ID=MMETSP0904-20121228/9863_1 /ASSEMBLY_ACC=CAM_ASM_000553 /TAXON_ID=420261 /ORGANISM="Thalassiosira antarctica, Strain CCMP982" /LENGTH=37 /DNA_ID= /DNA_START= /DNA_END= /DNA_ORIENTATION=
MNVPRSTSGVNVRRRVPALGLSHHLVTIPSTSSARPP